MIELRMEQCLKSVMNAPKQKRLRMAVRSPTWELIDKPHRGILSFAMNEEEVPSESDDQQNQPTQMRTKGRRLRNKSRGHTSVVSPQEYLPELIEMQQFELSSASTLAILLIRKQMKDPDWNDEFESLEGFMRNDCLENGVHPVWHTIAEKTNYLTQFLAFPKVRPKSESTTEKFNPKKATINPSDSSQVALLLSHALETTIDADLQVAMNRLVGQLQSSSSQSVKIEQRLLSLEDSLQYLSIILKFHSQHELSESNLDFLNEQKIEVAKNLLRYSEFQSNNYSHWAEVILLPGNNELERVLLELVWMNVPDEASELSSEQIDKGIEFINGLQQSKSQIDKLKWWKMSALQREGQGIIALEVLQDLAITSLTDIDALLNFLMIFPPDETSQWVLKFIDEIDIDGLSAILVSNHYEGELQILIAQRIFDSHGFEFEQERSYLLRAFVCGLDFERLTKIFQSDAMFCFSYPYDALFCYHATPASLSANSEKQFHDLRMHALQSLTDSSRPDYLSDSVEELLLLMEGIQLEPEALMKTLGDRVYIELKPVIKALHQGISEVNIQSSRLQALKLRLSALDTLTPLESRLFNVLFSTIAMNNTRQAFHNRMETPEQKKEMAMIVNEPFFTLTILQTMQELVLDYDLGIPELVEWYQKYSPSSPWQTLSRAANHVQRDEQLNAAREYKRIADQIHKVRVDSDDGKNSGEEVMYYVQQGVFGIEQEIALYRKALIHYAHAGQWSEALELLENNPSLKSALTKRFQLYLQVSNLADNQQTGPATRLIVSHVLSSITEEDQSGEGMRTRETYDEEELETLRSYTTNHAVHLPDKPFNGRVIAAHTELSRKLSRHRDEFERRFQMLEKESKFDLNEVYQLATEASDESPLTGLKILERAQHHRTLDTKGRQKLKEAEITLFKNHEEKIPLKHRSQLRQLNLKPLVVVDTNILINALIEEVYTHLGIIAGHQRQTMNQLDSSGDVLPNSGLGDFFRFLKNQSEIGKIFLHVPEVIREELSMFGDPRRLERQMNLKSMLSKSNNNEITAEFLEEKIAEVIEAFSTWNEAEHIEKIEHVVTPELEEFFVQHHEVFEEISSVKQKYGATTPRTKIAGKQYYPEENDMHLLHYAKAVSNLASKDIGVVLIASYDNDFTFISRALEETFGISVVRNPRTLTDWL